MDVLSPGEQRPGERTDDSGILAVATAIGGVASLVLGRMYDRVEIGSVLLGVVLSALFSAISVFLAAAGRLDAVGSRLRNAGHAFEGANCQCASGGEAEPGVRSTPADGLGFLSGLEIWTPKLRDYERKGFHSGVMMSCRVLAAHRFGSKTRLAI